MTGEARAGASVPRRLARGIQERLEAYYGLGGLPRVDEFLRPALDGERESLQLRYRADGDLDIAVAAPEPSGPGDLDGYCQVIEGVSHFVVVAERVRRELPVTQLELELQAEVDKFVLLALMQRRFEALRARTLHARLYEAITFCDPAGTEPGDRYRFANDLAARYVRRLAEQYAVRGRFGVMRKQLVRFHGAGQAEKLEMALAA